MTYGFAMSPSNAPVHHNDVHAIILHALGLAPGPLRYILNGREVSLTGGHSGKIVHDLFA